MAGKHREPKFGEIGAAMAGLPHGPPPPTPAIGRIRAAIRQRLDAHIAALQRVRADLHCCIGCGCLSLAKCALYNGRYLGRGRRRTAGVALVFRPQRGIEIAGPREVHERAGFGAEVGPAVDR